MLLDSEMSACYPCLVLVGPQIFSLVQRLWSRGRSTVLGNQEIGELNPSWSQLSPPLRDCGVLGCACACAYQDI